MDILLNSFDFVTFMLFSMSMLFFIYLATITFKAIDCGLGTQEILDGEVISGNSTSEKVRHTWLGLAVISEKIPEQYYLTVCVQNTVDTLSVGEIGFFTRQPGTKLKVTCTRGKFTKSLYIIGFA